MAGRGKVSRPAHPQELQNARGGGCGAGRSRTKIPADRGRAAPGNVLPFRRPGAGGGSTVPAGGWPVIATFLLRGFRAGELPGAGETEAARRRHHGVRRLQKARARAGPAFDLAVLADRPRPETAPKAFSRCFRRRSVGAEARGLFRARPAGAQDLQQSARYRLNVPQVRLSPGLGRGEPDPKGAAATDSAAARDGGNLVCHASP